MLIRFPRFVQHGNVQHQAGDVLDVPDEYAQAHIDAGHAVELPRAEAAVMPRYSAPPFAAFPGPRKSPRKGRR